MHNDSQIQILINKYHSGMYTSHDIDVTLWIDVDKSRANRRQGEIETEWMAEFADKDETKIERNAK